MARIRTIKPEFWTDEKIVQLPFTARLVFIGLWNFADDDGRVKDEPDRLRMQIMPGDPVDMELALDVLVAAELVERWYGDDGSVVLVIPGFGRHQVISHKAKSKLPLDRYRKSSIPVAARRQVAQKYGCIPGDENHPAECYFCGAPGSIYWPKRSDGKPSYWVAFSGLELDHFTPEASGGSTEGKNLVLSCRSCNRSRGDGDPHDFFPGNSGKLRNTPSGKEGNGKEGNGDKPGGGSSHPRVPAHEAPTRHQAGAAPIAEIVAAAPPPAWNSRENFDRVERRCREVLPKNWVQDLVVSPMARLEADGVDLEREIIPALLDLGTRRTPIRTWSLLANTVAERVAAQRSARTAEGLSAVPAAPVPDEEKIDLGSPFGAYTETVLRMALAKQRETGAWVEHLFGPAPGRPGCKIPSRLIIGEAA
ncbi:HNH endonuclease [Methylobacterium sp. CM6257]